MTFRDRSHDMCRALTRLCSLQLSRHLREHEFVDEVESRLPGPSEVQLGALLRELRSVIGMELDELSACCGLSVEALAAIEAGTHQADVHTLSRLAAGLGIRLGVIFSLWERGGIGDLDIGELVSEELEVESS